MANKNAESSSQPPPHVQPNQQQQQQPPIANEQEQEPHGDTCSIPPAQSGNTDSRSRGGNTVFKSGPLSISSKGIGWTSWKKRWFILTRTSLVFFRSDPADTMEDLHEWKAALENALTQAPSASHVMGQNGIFRNDHADPAVGVDEKKDETPTKSTVLGRPVLLALEDVDGAPSFLEKALRFVENHGVRIEGILRQAADVDDVEHRIREYEKVPASCCNALLEACRTDRGNRVNAMRAAICESFPEPNRRLLQRILMMMQTVASNKTVNRMNTNAVAACMAPLLLRPLLAGDCEIENDFDVGGDGSMQLLQAAAAANHAQAIVITLLEEYESIFGTLTSSIINGLCLQEGSLSPGLYSDSEESGSGTEEGSDDEEYDDDDDGSQGSEDYTDEEEDLENESNGSYSESAASEDKYADSIDPDDHKARSKEPKKLLSGSRRSSLPRHDDGKKDEDIVVKGVNNTEVKAVVEVSTSEDKNSSTSDVASDTQKPSKLSDAPGGSKRHWGRTPGKKNLSMESIDFSVEVDEDNADIERLESTKLELQSRITEEVKSNAVLQASLERRKKALYGRRQALEQDLKKDLQEVAQAEADIAKLEHKVDDLENRLGHHDGKASGSTHSASKESRKLPEHNAKMKEKQKDTEAASTHISERSTSKTGNILQDGQGAARENETEKQQDSRSKSSQQETSRGSSKLVGLSKRSGTKGEERRSQIANELQNMDKGKTLGQPSPTSGQNRVSEETEKGSGSNQDPDSSKLQSPHILDRGRSENGGDRGRGSSGGNHPNTTPRTFSR
ncbi:putative protein [Arabidopsis thaliana]|nr:putative protein [Arabidopsis thaliana]CAB79368.1 putative protein [Arabidopsis thaliana]